jgi:hypothetical protein
MVSPGGGGGDDARSGPCGRDGRGEGRLEVGASGKEEKEEAPMYCFLLSLRPSAPLPPTTSIFFGCS